MMAYVDDELPQLWTDHKHALAKFVEHEGLFNKLVAEVLAVGSRGRENSCGTTYSSTIAAILSENIFFRG